MSNIPKNGNELKNLATSLGAEYLNISGVFNVFYLPLWKFKKKVFKHLVFFPSVSKAINIIYKKSKNSEEAIREMYDVEYGGDNGSNYMYLNGLLDLNYFEKIIGYKKGEIVNKKIIDIGAGSNELLRFLNSEIGISKDLLYGVDISPASRDIIVGDGFHGFCGRTENLKSIGNKFDVVSLSYFVDYDTDQLATFDAAVEKVSSHGKIILEGIFPSKYLGLLEKDISKCTFITKGNSAVEDINLVCGTFVDLGKKYDKKIKVERIVKSWRYIYNRLGLNKRPSFFLIFSVT